MIDKEKHIIFCGGGSGGHVQPALTLIQEIQEQNLPIKIDYIGSYQGIERQLISTHNISYFPISTGKLRRYLSFENVKDIFRVLKGFFQAISFLKNHQGQSLLFCTGGFVTVPVAFAAFFCRIPIYLHEQTTRAGLANRLCSLVAKKVFTSFPESNKYFSSQKTSCLGYPLRSELALPLPPKLSLEGYDLLSLNLPILFVTGGGNGSLPINNFIKKHLPSLTEKYFVIHQVGGAYIKQFKDISIKNYLAVDFLKNEMIPILQLAKVIISRAGAGTVSELMGLGKPSLFIPLKIAQKNEQYFNALAAQKKLGSIIIQEDDLPQINLLQVCQKIESIPILKISPNDIHRSRLEISKEIMGSFSWN